MIKLRKNLLAALLMGILALGGVACQADDAGTEPAPADDAATPADDTGLTDDTGLEETPAEEES